MRPAILFVLTCVPLSLAIPSPSTASSARFVSHKFIQNLQRSTLAVSDRQNGLSLTPCLSDSDCVASRPCLKPTEQGSVSCASITGDCACLPSNSFDLLCTSGSDCEPGEVCFTFSNAPKPICASEAIANLDLGGTVVGGGALVDDEDNFPDQGSFDDDDDADTPDDEDATGDSIASLPTLPPTTTEAELTTVAITSTESSESGSTSIIPILGGIGGDDSNNTSSEGGSAEQEGDSEGEEEEPQAPSGLTLDPCRQSVKCKGARNCVDISSGGSCDGGDCRCLDASLSQCDSDSEYDEGEGCFGVGDVADFPFVPDEVKDLRACASRAAAEKAKCIASHSLTHISKDDLVFQTDAVSHVLCDINDSCATPGHMVQYKGKGMMMKTYCDLNGCERKVMRVNSPKYRRGLMIASKTEELEFSALAARFESRAEEGVLSVAVRFGL